MFEMTCNAGDFDTGIFGSREMNNAIRTTKSERDILECFQETLSPLDYTSSTLDTLKNRESGIHGFLFSTDQVERNEMFYHNNNSCTVGKTSGSILVSNLNSSLPLSDAHRSINFNNSNNNSSNSLNTMNFLMVPNNTPREQISTNTDWRNNYSLDAMYDDAKDSKDCANGLNFEAKERRRERNKVLARKTRVKKKVELESLQERVIALMKENEKLKIMANMRIPSPVSAEILMSCDFHLPDNVTEAVRNIIANDATTAINELKTKQRSFCIINAIASDYPIVYASPGFLKLTGYEMKEVLGRNCRFLQGQNTDTEEVNLMKRNVNSGIDMKTVLMNYKKDGTPFWNQIEIAHLRDVNGNPSLIIGVQNEISMNVSTSRTDLLSLDDGSCNSFSTNLLQLEASKDQVQIKQENRKFEIRPKSYSRKRTSFDTAASTSGQTDGSSSGSGDKGQYSDDSDSCSPLDNAVQKRSKH